MPTTYGIYTAAVLADLDIPEGFVHRSVLVSERGWRGAEITAHLGDVARFVPVPELAAHLVSNKVYPLEAVIAAEQTVPEVIAAQAERAAQQRALVGTISRSCGHESHAEANTWSVGEIAARGWRQDQIWALLGTAGEKDVPEEWQWGVDPKLAARRCRWRVEEAEYYDSSLHERSRQLAQTRQERAERAAADPTAPPARLLEVLVPGPVSGAVRSWRRLITAIDPLKEGAFALAGPGLVAGARYEIGVGDLIVTCDKLADRRQIRLLRVSDEHPQDAGLQVVKEWTIKAPLGARIVAFVERRMPLPPVGTARALQDPVNRFAGRCWYCRQEIDAGAGVLTAVGGGTRVVHPGGCPPLASLPARRNEFGGYCRHCAKAVPAGAGLVSAHTIDISVASGPFKVASVALGGLSRTEWVHEHRSSQDCARAKAWLPNRGGDWCLTCDGWVYPQDGFWVSRTVQHEPGTCTRAPGAPVVWRVMRSQGDYQVGTTIRASIDRRPGDSDPDALGVPGFVRAPDGSCSMLVTVLDARTGGGIGEDDRQMALVRAATWQEAEPLIAAELDTAAALPATGTFLGSWTAEKIGPSAQTFLRWTMGSGTPWVAQLSGFRRRGGGFTRRFLDAKRDYTDANRAGTRGVEYFWELESGPVYEAYWPISWSRAERAYLVVDAEGQVRTLDRAQVEAWFVRSATAEASAAGDGEGSDIGGGGRG